MLVYLGLGAASHAVATAMADAGWTIPVLANSALMFGYVRPDWRDAWANWEYIDTIADDNAWRRRLGGSTRRGRGGPDRHRDLRHGPARRPRRRAAPSASTAPGSARASSG